MKNNIILPPHMQPNQGKVNLEIGEAQDKVIIRFGRDIDGIVFEPKEAAEFALNITRVAESIAKRTGQLVPKRKDQN